MIHLSFIGLIATCLLHVTYSQTHGSFDASSVSLSTRTSWCNAQTGTCRTLCAGRASTNNCNPDSLSYACVCLSGTVPAVSNYQSTIPYFICQQMVSDCTAANPGNLAKCASTCGTLQPSAVPGSSATSTQGVASGTAGGGTEATSSTNTVQTTSISNSTASATATSSHKGAKSTVSTGAAVGIAIGAAVLAIAFSVAVGWAIVKRRHWAKKSGPSGKRESGTRAPDGRYRELANVPGGYARAFGRGTFEKDGDQAHEMGLVTPQPVPEAGGRPWERALPDLPGRAL